jgi:hypothetical protein
VAAAVPTSDTPLPRGGKLAAVLAAQLAGRRGEGNRALPEPSGLAEARVAARGESALIHLTIEIAGGKLRVTADVYPVPRTVWGRIRDPEPGPVEHAFAEALIDAELRSFLAPVPLSAASVERARNFESDVVALACGDLDGDAALEIVSVSRRRVTLSRLREGKVLPLLSRPWTDLAPVHPTPLREPLAFATLVEREVKGSSQPSRFVDIALTDRAKSLRMGGDLAILAAFPGLALPDGDRTACTRVSGLTASGPLGPCAPGDPAPHFPTVGGQYDAVASARLFSPKGEPFLVWAGRERGSVELRDSAGRREVIDSAGAQLAIGDLDQDGNPEIVTSLDVLNPLEDAVVVRSWARDAKDPAARKPRELFRLPAAAGVRALAVCPPEGAGRAPFAVATADEIWVVR